LPIFNKINLICKTAGQEPQQHYKLLQWPPVVQYQQICNKIFVWPSLSVDRSGVFAVGRPTVGRRVVAAWLLQIIYLHLSPPPSDSDWPPSRTPHPPPIAGSILFLQRTAFPFAYQIACNRQSEKCRANINIRRLETGVTCTEKNPARYNNLYLLFY